jgi:assimilatory nitrate reductase catalytic subunit
MELSSNGTVKPLMHPVNGGKLCVLGLSSGALLNHGERLTTPLVRKNGALTPCDWEEALETAARGFQQIAEGFGPQANAVYGGASLSNEKVYLLGKLARVALKTPHLDYNGRYCMSAAATAQNRAFGLDRGLNRPLADLPRHDLILLIGSNPAECLPMLMPHLMAAKQNGTRFITVDPRQTTSANLSTLHLALRPGSDLALANALLNLIEVKRGFVEAKTEGFEEALRAAGGCTAEWAAEVCGLKVEEIQQAAHLLNTARHPLILTGRGADQNVRGVKTSLAFINVALALGGEFGTLTGQANGQGGREMGQKNDQLPGYRQVEDPSDREAVAGVWGIEADDLPGKGYSALEILQAIGRKEIRGMLVLGSNPVVSSPGSDGVRQALAAMEHLVVMDPFLSETAAQAKVVLPGALWSEETGTVTNLEGRVLLRPALQAAPEGARGDLEILCSLAAGLGARKFFDFTDSKAVFDELRLATRGAKADYFGITYERLQAGEELFWPCPDVSHSGTPRPFAEQFAHPGGRAKFFATPFSDLSESISPAYPLALTTGRVLYHFLSGNFTRRLERLNKKSPAPHLEVHPDTAQKLGLIEGELGRLSTRRSQAEYRVKLNAKIRPDTVFVPFHWDGGLAVNRLMNPALDPCCQMPEFKFAAAALAGAAPEPESLQLVLAGGLAARGEP